MDRSLFECQRTLSNVVGLLLIVLSVASGLSTASAQKLSLPEGATNVLQQIRQQCPECLSVGFTACGSSDIGYGLAFAGNVLRGTPPRGYLVTYVMSGDEFRRLARTSDYETLMKVLRKRFAQARLIVLEDRFAAARVISEPEVEVVFPAALHKCVQDLKKPWGCCVSDCRYECCEKDLGSPSVQLTWRDQPGGETIVFKFHHMVGMSMLERNGSRRVVYFCLVDQPGRLTLGGRRPAMEGIDFTMLLTPSAARLEVELTLVNRRGSEMFVVDVGLHLTGARAGPPPIDVSFVAPATVVLASWLHPPDPTITFVTPPRAIARRVAPGATHVVTFAVALPLDAATPPPWHQRLQPTQPPGKPPGFAPPGPPPRRATAREVRIELGVIPGDPALRPEREVIDGLEVWTFLLHEAEARQEIRVTRMGGLSLPVLVPQ